MHYWDEPFPAPFEAEAQQIKKVLCAKHPLFKEIASDSLIRCLFWIVFPDCEGRIESRVATRLLAEFGNPQQHFNELAQKIESLAKKVEKYCALNPFFPMPPRGMPEQL